MNKEEIDIDRHYDEELSKYQEVAKVPFSDYKDLEEKYDKLERQLKAILEFIGNDDCAGAYEYAFSEGLL